jgi:hypothetical protein
MKRCLGNMALGSHVVDKGERERSLVDGDTESSESCIGLTHGQVTVKMGETSWLSS